MKEINEKEQNKFERKCTRKEKLCWIPYYIYSYCHDMYFYTMMQKIQTVLTLFEAYLHWVDIKCHWCNYQQTWDILGCSTNNVVTD